MNRVAILSVCFVCVMSVLLTASCNIVTPIALIVAPPPTQEAEYALPDRPTAVFVDDRRNALGDRPLLRYIGDKICENLMTAEVLVEHIPIRTRDVLAVVGNEERGDLMSLGEIGEAVGAEQIIYVEMLAFLLVSEEEQPKAQAQLRLKVVDIPNKTRVYPEQADGDEYRMLFVDLPSEVAFKPQMTRATAREAELALADLIAERVSKLFYEYEIRPLGERINTETR